MRCALLQVPLRTPTARRVRAGRRGIPALGIAASAWLGAMPVRAQVGSPAGPVPVERLAARREALLQSLGSGVAIVRSGQVRDIERDYPQDSDYRENNDFFYLTGLESPDSWLVLLARDSAPDSVVLFVPPGNLLVSRWTGRTGSEAAELGRISGIGDVRSPESPDDSIPALVLGPRSPLRRGGSLFLSQDPRGGDPPLLRRLVQRAERLDRPAPVADLRGSIARLRLVKDAEELRRLREAIDITSSALREAMGMARPGLREYELEARIEYIFRQRGAERLGFPSIVGSGPNSVSLHYDRNRRKTAGGDLVVMDVGAEYGYLTADLTRTVPVSGRFSDRQRRLYDLVLGSQQAALAQARPGITLGMLDRVARGYMQEHSGNLCGSVTCDRYFVHGLSHWLGMDVHDVGSYATPLAPGMVFTVEPGVYLPEEGLGIRIEDDVLVTESGHELLSRRLPRTADEVERAMAGNR